jgi:hypothetical protein
MIADAYGKVNRDDRSSGVDAISERLWLSMLLFADVERPGSGDAIVDVAQEAYFVANGDKPKLFAQMGGKQGKRDNTAHIAIWELRALEWDYWLASTGEKPGSRHELIAGAYGVPWPTIMKWDGKLRSHFGMEAYEYKIAVATTLGSLSSPIGDLDADGARYRAALRSNV